MLVKKGNEVFKLSRSKLGKFIDKHKIKQIDIAKASGLTTSTISRLAKIDCISPSIKNANKVVQALKKITGKNIKQSDFWS
ncbi:transcriptional regulator [Bacillus paranthracis]